MEEKAFDDKESVHDIVGYGDMDVEIYLRYNRDCMG